MPFPPLSLTTQDTTRRKVFQRGMEQKHHVHAEA